MKTRFSIHVGSSAVLGLAVGAVLSGIVGVACAQSQVDLKLTPTMTVTGAPGPCEVQWAPTVGTTGWTPLTNLTLAPTGATVLDTGGAATVPRFYRALSASGSTRLELRMRVSLTVSGAAGTHQIQFADPRGWVVLTNVLLAGAPVTFDDPTAPANGRRLYRAYSVPENPDPAHLVWIPPGSFTMGSPTNEVDRYDWEGPQMAVTLSQGFWLGKFEVTQREYLAVMKTNPSPKTDLTCPVQMVSWVDATNYCAKLTVRERTAGRLPAGCQYRLPTEAEWEYGCRAGTSTRFSFGDDPGYTDLGNYAWYGYGTGPGGGSHPVGEKLPNAWGLYDMHGNVWEWCLDWYGAYPGGRVTDPKGPSALRFRVLRGGDWFYYARNCRSAFRNYDVPGYKSYVVGFRVVLAPGQP